MAFDRKSKLCDQTALTGIDFVQIVEPQVQTLLRVFFMVDPADLDTPMADPGQLPPPPANQEAGPPLDAAGLDVRIVSEETGEPVALDSLAWRRVRGAAGIRTALELEVKRPGDFALHRLTIGDDRVDPFFNGRIFSFKQGCPSVFDCRQPCEPDAIDGPDHPVDYLARDFGSLRRALLDFAAERYPGWSEPLEADQAVMLMEVMAALGDEFAYTQDRISRELTLETATQRRSRAMLARLVDYVPDPGNAATAELAVTVAAGKGGASAPGGARAWARREGRPPIPFSVRLAHGEQPVWHHEAWNALQLHQPDSDIACLPAGAHEAFLVTGAPTAAQLPSGETKTPEEFWAGRRAILRETPATGERRAFAVTVTAVERLQDPLAGLAILRVEWAEPTPWPMRLDDTVLLGNVVTVTAGEERREHFRVGPYDPAAPLPLGLTVQEAREIPRAVEREGPFDADQSGRGRILRYGLRGAETEGLGWEGPRDPLGIGGTSGRRPMLELTQLGAGALHWTWLPDILSADLDKSAFTLEEGTWRTVHTHRTAFADIPFDDYAGDAGWTLRFGDGAFGRAPADGSVFTLTYHSAPGAEANLAPDSITVLGPPPGAPPAPGSFAYAAAVTNPLPVTDGRDPEAPADVGIDAPEAWRARPLRAVRREDYRAIVERLGWVQRANATTVWTGSWPTDIVAADPLAGTGYQPAQRDALEDVVDCVRLATRDARVMDPDYLDLDLEVSVCAAPDAYAGELAPRVVRALAPPGLFDPANFTFGEPLRRSSVEAAVQAVPGVHGVEAIRVRVRRGGDWQAFDSPELAVAPDQILRLENDPLHPSRGSLRILAHGGAG